MWILKKLSRRKQLLLLAALMACLFLVYHNYSRLLLFSKHYPSSSVSNTSLSLLYNNMRTKVSTNQISQRSTAEETSVTDKVTCYKTRGKDKYKTCPQCFRPNVPRLDNGSFYEIGPNDESDVNKSSDYFKARSEVVQPLITDYLIVPSFNSSNYYLLAVQPSILDRRYERDIVRNTWGSVARQQTWPNRKINANVNLLFVVARQNVQNGDTNNTQNNTQNSTRQFEEIASEAAQNNDILFIDMIDGYWNLTLKLLSAFKWVKDKCPCVKFILKVDYDTFVNVPLLVDTLLYFEDRFEFSVLGRAYLHASVKRWGKWGVPKDLYPMDKYMAYTSGCGYVLSYKVLSKVVDTAPYVPMFSIEDAYITGVLRGVIGFRMFTFQEMFTHYSERWWYWCLMLQDQKIVGTSKDGGTRHYYVWSSFTKRRCK